MSVHRGVAVMDREFLLDAMLAVVASSCYPMSNKESLGAT